jgi:hypothetical protein
MEKLTTADWPRPVNGTYLPQWRLEIKMVVVVVLADMTTVKVWGKVTY